MSAWQIIDWINSEICIYKDGSVSIEYASEKTAQELLDEGVWQAFCFGFGRFRIRVGS